MIQVKTVASEVEVAPVVNRQVHHFLDLDSMPWDEIWSLLKIAQEYRTEFSKHGAVEQVLKRKSIVGAFFENSTRTRVSFELAAKHLGAKFIDFKTEASSTAKGESLRNTLLTLQALGASAIVARHAMAGFPYFAARILNIPFINAGDGAHAHPTQTLSDLLTLVDKYDTLRGLKVVCVGDFLHSRVARSFASALLKFGSSVTVAAPATMQPNYVLKNRMKLEPFSQIKWTNNLQEAITGADVIMALRVHKERHQIPSAPKMSSYSHKFALQPEHIETLSPKAVVLHAGPVNEGVDLSVALAHSKYCEVENQVRNGLFVRMVVLQRACLGVLS